MPIRAEHTPTAVEASNLETVTGLLEDLLGARRFEAAARLFHPGYTEHDRLIPAGPDGPVRHWENLSAHLRGLAVRVDQAVADHDRVMLMCSWRGSGPSGGERQVHTAELFRLVEGRVAEHWDVVDRAALAGFGIEPADAPQPARPGLHGTHSDAERANAELVLGAYREVFSEHRLEAADRYYHHDYRHHNLRTDAVPDGLEAFKAFFADNLAAFPDLTTEVDHLVCRGDRVMVFVTWRGTLTGRWSGGGPSGRSLTMRTCDQFRIDAGKVAEHWEVVDYGALRQAGLPTP